MSDHGKHCVHERGFTIIELVVIIIIIGVLAVFATGRFANDTSFQTRGYFDELLSATRFAQRYAVASGCDVQIQIAGDYSYALTTQDAICGVGTAVQGPGGGAFGGAAPAGVTATVGTHRFDARGALIAGGGVVQVSDGSSTHAFTITSNTGYVAAP